VAGALVVGAAAAGWDALAGAATGVVGAVTGGGVAETAFFPWVLPFLEDLPAEFLVVVVVVVVLRLTSAVPLTAPVELPPPVPFDFPWSVLAGFDLVWPAPLLA
jgi:hypothetical protein